LLRDTAAPPPSLSAAEMAAAAVAASRLPAPHSPSRLDAALPVYAALAPAAALNT